jgi:hypothetical protein
MDPGAALVKFLELVIVAGCAVTGVKLFLNGLFRRYRALTSYLVFRAFVTGTALLFFDKSSSPEYMKFWILTEPIIWVFYVLNVIELYSLVLEKHRGLYTLGRWFLYAGLSISVVISGLALLPKLNGGTAQVSKVMGYYIAIERGVDFALLIFLLLILLWLTQYPVPLSRNVVIHSLAYSILFLSSSAGLFVRAVFGIQVSTSVSTFFLGIGTACILIWLVFLTPKGEEVRVSLPIFGPEQEQRILSHLEALNNTLLKVSRN